MEWYFNYREKRASECSRPFLRLITKNFGSVVGGSFMNAFFNIFGLFYDLFRVKVLLYSAIPRENAVELLNAGRKAVVAATSSSSWCDLTHTPTYISAAFPTATLPDNAKPFASAPTSSPATTPASVSTEQQPKSS